MGLINSVALAKRYLSLMPVTPPDYYEHREPLQRARMEYESERTEEGFHRIIALDLRDKDVLDLGCGYGGRMVYFKELGARSVTGIEIADRMVEEAFAFAKEKGVAVRAAVGFGERIPFPDNSFDAITSYDVFEHVESLPTTLAECYRVLRPDGVVYAAFPPFHHPTGGSHLHGYISRSPAPNVLFSCATLREAIPLVLEERGVKYRPTIRANDPLPSVNGTTVASFFRMLRAIPFTQKRITLDPLRSRRFWWLNWMPALGVHAPLLREVCTSRIRCQLVK